LTGAVWRSDAGAIADFSEPAVFADAAAGTAGSAGVALTAGVAGVPADGSAGLAEAAGVAGVAGWVCAWTMAVPDPNTIAAPISNILVDFMGRPSR